MGLTAGLSNSCAAKTGGASKIWLFDADGATFASWAETSNEWDTLVTGTSHIFEFELDSAEYRFNSSRENGSIKVEHEVEFFTKGLSTAQRDRLQEIAEQNCGLFAIVKDNEGNRWMVGASTDFGLERPLYMESIAGTSGKEMTDLTGSTVVLKSTDNAFSKLVASSISDSTIDGY